MKHLSWAALLAVVSPSVVAAENLAFDPVIVTANRMAQTADEALAAVTVITREDIERLQPPTILELLRLQPGLDIARTGGPGAQTGVFLRGTNSDHTLVLVDGVRANSATAGSFAWSSLAPEQIERIEIVRGPRAALYGADAIGGVVQIFTRKPAGVTANAEYGSDNTRKLELGYGGGERVRYRFLGSFSESDGIPSRTVSERDHGYENRSLSAGIDLPLWNGARLALDGWISDSKSEYDEDGFDPVTYAYVGVVEKVLDTQNRTLSARLTDTLSEAWSYSLQTGYAADENEYSNGEFSTERYSLDWVNTLTLSERQTVLLGLNYYHDAVDSHWWDIYDETADNKAVFVNYLAQFGRFDVEAAARHDRHSEFGGHTTGSAALGLQLTPQLRLFLSHGTAFKAPTFNDLFSPGYGNPDLEPEESHSTELGLRATRENQQFEANLFYTEVDNLIVYGPAPLYRKENVDAARIRGLEAAYALSAGAWNFRLNATLQKARNADDDSRLLRRPDRKLNLLASYTFKNRAIVNAETVLVGEREDVDATELPGYGLVNLSASYPLGRGLRLHGRIENALDKDYEVAAGYNTLGRSVYVGLSYQPGAK